MSWFDWVSSPKVGENILPYNSINADSQKINGFKANIPASSIRTNTALRQSTLVTAALMNSLGITDIDYTSDLSTVQNRISAYFSKYISNISTSKVTFIGASQRANIISGEQLDVICGKINKYFQDLQGLAFLNKIGNDDISEYSPIAPTNLDTFLLYKSGLSVNKESSSTYRFWLDDLDYVNKDASRITPVNYEGFLNIGFIDSAISNRFLVDFYYHRDIDIGKSYFTLGNYSATFGPATGVEFTKPLSRFNVKEITLSSGAKRRYVDFDIHQWDLGISGSRISVSYSTYPGSIGTIEVYAFRPGNYIPAGRRIDRPWA